MNKAIKALRIIASAILLALAVFIVLAAPGFLSDASSTVPIGDTAEAGR